VLKKLNRKGGEKENRVMLIMWEEFFKNLISCQLTVASKTD